MVRKWWHQLFSQRQSGVQRGDRRARVRQRRMQKPLLESLEDRCLMSYTVTDLGTLGGRGAEAFGIDDAGQVVGWADTQVRPLRQHAFLWDSGVMTDLDANGEGFGGRISQANGINNAGQVVGFGFSPRHAALWEGAAMTDLGTLGGNLSEATAINNAGQVVGGSNTPNSSHAFRWQDGVMTDLGALSSGGSYATAINDLGQVVGTSAANNQTYPPFHAFLWQENAGMTDLGTLPGDVDSQANGINHLGHVVGWSGDINGAFFQAFFYDGTTMIDLGLPQGSGASAINDSDQAVGGVRVFHGNAYSHAFLSANGVVTDLNDLIPPNSGLILDSATAINNAGQIVGIAHRTDGPFDGTEQHAFLLSPDGQTARRSRGTGSNAPGVFLGLAWVPEAANIGSITNQPPASALREPAPVETVAPLPASAVVRQVTDAVFATSHRANASVSASDWEVTEF